VVSASLADSTHVRGRFQALVLKGTIVPMPLAMLTALTIAFGRSISSSAFATERNLDAQSRQERLRGTEPR
jgi:hypothetical protein